MQVLSINQYGIEWQINSEKAAFLPIFKTLLIADVHLGKLMHFRKAGIGLPIEGEELNLERIRAQIVYFKPKSVVFLGDLFHSKKNSVWTAYRSFIAEFPSVHFILVKGNHDVFADGQFNGIPNMVTVDEFNLGALILSHEPLIKIPKGYYNVCGHIHPAVKLGGSGGQKAIVNCFLFKSNLAVLPAFGEFTGTYTMKCEINDSAFGIVGDEIFKLN